MSDVMSTEWPLNGATLCEVYDINKTLQDCILLGLTKADALTTMRAKLHEYDHLGGNSRVAIYQLVDLLDAHYGPDDD